MTKFINTLIKFFCIGTLISVILLISAFIFSSTKNILNLNFLEKNKNIVILGDSNTMCAINDSVFRNSKNFSSSAEPYFESFSKIQKLLLEDVKVDYIFLSYAPHNLYECPFPDRKRDYKYISYKTFKKLFIYKDNKLEFVNSVVKDKLKMHFEINGRFKKLQRNNLEDHRLSLSRNKNLINFPDNILSKENNHKINQNQKYFLEKIIKICDENNIKLILINVPKIKDLLNDDRYCVAKFNTFHNTHYRDITYIDHSDLELDEKYFSDFVHLNYMGANIYSEYLNDLFHSLFIEK